MIRRELKTADGTVNWLLISQVEHARISGELARAWSEPCSLEVVEAITHHDDGWEAWELAPQLDPQLGRPFSFLEMPLAESLAIWDGSIAAVRGIGPLAAAIVAGHFLGLAHGSDQASQPNAQHWLRETARQRSAWLAEWHAALPANTDEAARRGQRMLLTADLLSLWLCCDGPVTSGESGSPPNAEMKSRSAAVLGKYRFIVHDQSARHAEVVWRGSLAPWPFAVGELSVTAPGVAAPVARYHSWQELAAASWPVELRWRLRQTLPGGAEC